MEQQKESRITVKSNIISKSKWEKDFETQRMYLPISLIYKGGGIPIQDYQRMSEYKKKQAIKYMYYAKNVKPKETPKTQ